MSTNAPLQNKLLFPFVAPPNGGKGTQTRILSQRYNLPVFDMGATFRAILKNGKYPELAAQIKARMDAGKLVSPEIVLDVFTKGVEELAAQNPTAKGFILDGFPRNVEQAVGLAALLQKWNARLGKVIYLNVSIPTVEKRATGRRFCSANPDHVYNIYEPKFMPKNKQTDAQGQEVWLCDQDNSELVLRADDQPDTVKKRLAEYSAETDPLINLFKQKGELAEVNGEQAPEKVTQAIEATIQPILGLSPAP